jgi:hypothetical protein
MKLDARTEGPEGKKPEGPKRAWIAPRLTEYGSVAQLSRALATGTFKDAAHMASQGCQGQCQ